MDTGCLYVIATPIGNLDDMAPRAIATLKACAVAAAEDTRHSRKLFERFAIETPLTSYHEHNEAAKADELLLQLQDGKDIALITDAGTPCISDPGYRLVRAAHEAGVPVRTVPGPSALAAALSVSGLPSDRVVFHGFFPRKASAAESLLEEAAAFPATHVFYESPQRIEATLARVAGRFPESSVCLSRELTKVFEETVCATAANLLERVRETPPRGECVLLLEVPRAAARESMPEPAELRQRVDEAMEKEGLSRRDAVRAVAKALGLPRNAVYAAAVEPECPPH